MFINGQKVKFGNSPVKGMVKATRNDGPTSEYEETLVFFDDGDRCWVGSCDLSIVQDVVISQGVPA